MTQSPDIGMHAQIGPEKGAIHLATGAIVNALWDMWAKYEHKPLWRLLVDMEPAQLVSTIDFRYITDALVRALASDTCTRSCIDADAGGGHCHSGEQPQHASQAHC